MNERSRTKYIILGMLTIEPSSGYEINKRIKSSTSYFWNESEGQIYPALAKCVTDGLATCVGGLSSDNARFRKIYSITEKGRKVLATWLEKEAQNTLIRNEFLLKIFFGGNIENKYVITHLLKFEEEMKKELMALEKIKLKLTTTEKDPAQAKFWLLSAEFGIKSIKANLLWCEEALASLK